MPAATARVPDFDLHEIESGRLIQWQQPITIPPPTIPTSTVVTQKMDRVAGKVSKKQTDRDAKIERDGRPNEYKNACCQILNLYVMLVLLLFDTNR